MAKGKKSGYTEAEMRGLLRQLEYVQGDARKAAKAISRTSARPLVARAKQLAPVWPRAYARYKDGKAVEIIYPGNLRESIEILPLRKTKTSVIIGPNLKDGGKPQGYYAHMVEFGTVKAAPEPYMRPAFEQTKQTIIDMQAKGAKRRIKAALKAKGFDISNFK